jgi:hypothetical protein
LEQITPKLKSLNAVTGVELISHKDSVSRFQVHVQKGKDIREPAFRLAVAEGWVLLELTPRSTSLEEVFHKLTMS